tara:strand:- start:534 stop:1049 length:516 start_codon:yes stop_codon:yes gene_type:complete
MSTLRVDSLQGQTAGTNRYVVQVVSTTKTDTFSTTSESYTDITGLSATITPINSQNKVLAMFTVYMAMSTAGWGGMVQLQRGSTAICVGDASSSRTQASASFYMVDNVQFVNSISNSFLDSPNTTSETTYKLLGRTQSSSYTMYVNRNGSDQDNASVPRLASSLTLMEIAQ